MRLFKNTWFNRFAAKEGITDDELREIVNILEGDLADAGLGGDVYKIRVARKGKGKSGGYRVIVFFKSGERTFFQDGFAKSDRGNISPKALRYFKKLAKKYLALSETGLNAAVKAGEFIEI